MKRAVEAMLDEFKKVCVRTPFSQLHLIPDIVDELYWLDIVLLMIMPPSLNLASAITADRLSFAPFVVTRPGFWAHCSMGPKSYAQRLPMVGHTAT